MSKLRIVMNNGTEFIWQTKMPFKESVKDLFGENEKLTDLGGGLIINTDNIAYVREVKEDGIKIIPKTTC